MAVYIVAFYATTLPSVRDDAGRPLLRIELLGQLALLPEESLLPNWFGDPPEFSLLDRLPVLLLTGFILAWAAALGRLLMGVCRADRGLCRGETAVFSVAVGLNGLSTWVLLLGLFGVLDRFWTCIVPAILTLVAAVYFARRHAAADKRADKRAAAALPEACPQNDILGPRLLWLAVPFVLVILLAGMLPPLDFDVCEYHLQAPKEFFQQGQITFLPHNVYANMAMGTEMLSLLAMVAAGDWWLGALAGKTVIAMFAPLTAMALFLVGRRLFSRTAGVVAALVYISTPWVVSIASGGFVEGASASYLLLAIYALLLRGRVGMPMLVLAGYLAGGAVATKYPAALFVLFPLAVWVTLTGNGQTDDARSATAGTISGGRSRAASLIVFLLAALVGCGLWFGKNWVQTGNPTYPLLYEVFDGKTWDAEKNLQWRGVHRPHDFSAETLGRDLGRVALTSPWLSPLIVPLAILAFIGAGRLARLRWGLLAYVGFAVAAWWLLTHRIDRFWIPVLPIMALLAGAGACWNAARWWRTTLAALLLAGLGANFLVATMGQANAWFVDLARLRTAPGRIDPWHAYFNARADGGRLLAVGDAAVFDLTMPVLYNTCFDDCIFEQLVRDKTAAQVRAELAARQIEYVYVDWREIERYREPGNYGFTDFVQPEVFDRLVQQGVLAPLPPIEGHGGQGYRVVGTNGRPEPE